MLSFVRFFKYFLVIHILVALFSAKLLASEKNPVDESGFSHNLVVQDLCGGKHDLVHTRQVISGLRYAEEISNKSISILKALWKGESGDECNLSADVIADQQTRIGLAEYLGSRADGEEREEYLNYLRDIVENEEDAELRSLAATPLGMIGSAEDIDLLSYVLLNDSLSPAMNAFIGLLAMNTPESCNRVIADLQALNERGNARDKRIYSIAYRSAGKRPTNCDIEAGRRAE